MQIEPEKFGEPLGDKDWEAFARLLDDERWPDTTLDLEGADGVIAAGVCGPPGATPADVLPLIFGQDDMPAFANEESRRLFLELATRRWNEYAAALAMAPGEMTEESLAEPFFFEVDAAQLKIARNWKTPQKPKESDYRPGDWIGRAWATGFMRVVSAREDDWWEIVAVDEQNSNLFAPLLFLEIGFNPEDPRMRFDPEEWMGEATANLYHFANLYRSLAEGAFTREPVVRAVPKVGRNDPCSCGSGLKYKKCCGAPGAEAKVKP